jgi:hypothetical protein
MEKKYVFANFRKSVNQKKDWVLKLQNPQSVTFTQVC